MNSIHKLFFRFYIVSFGLSDIYARVKDAFSAKRAVPQDRMPSKEIVNCLLKSRHKVNVQRRVNKN